MEPQNRRPKHDLTEEDRIHILTAFQEEMVPKLAGMDARIGNIGCAFAGEAYKDWTLQFRSAGSGFEVVDFEYDENARDLDLPSPASPVHISDHV